MGCVLSGQALFFLLIFCFQFYLRLAFSPLEVLIQTMFLHFLLTGIHFLFIIPTALFFIHFTVRFITFSLCLSSLLTYFCFHISAGVLTDGHSLMSQDLLLYPDSHVICKIFSFLSYAPLSIALFLDQCTFRFTFLTCTFFTRLRQVLCAFQRTTSRK